MNPSTSGSRTEESAGGEPGNRFVLKIGVAVVLLAFVANFLQLGFRPMSILNVDETAWIYSSYYYHLAFERLDVHSKDWHARDAIDHPPLNKYLIGSALAMVNYRVTSLDLKHSWSERTDVYDMAALVEEAEHLPPFVLPVARAVSTAMFAAAGVLLMLVTRELFASSWAGVLAGLLLAASPLIREMAASVMAEGIFTALLMLSIWLQLRLVAAWRRRTSGWCSAVALGLVLGMLPNVKINGFAVLPIAVGSLMVGSLAVRRQTQRDAAAGIHFAMACVASFIAILTLFALNPSLWHEPIRFLQAMIRYRAMSVDGQLIFIYHLSMPNFPIKLAAVMSGIFRANEALFPFCLLLSAFVVGLLRAGEKFRKMPVAWLVFAINGTGWLICNWMTFQINGPRYLLVTAPFVFIIAGGGLFEMINGFQNTAKTIFGKITIVSSLLFLLILAPYFMASVTTVALMKEFPEWEIRSKQRIEQVIRKTAEEKPGQNGDLLNRLVPK